MKTSEFSLCSHMTIKCVTLDISGEYVVAILFLLKSVTHIAFDEI